MEFCELPDDPIIVILGKLDTVVELLKMCQISKRFNSLIRTPLVPWPQKVKITCDNSDIKKRNEPMEKLKYIMDHYQFNYSYTYYGPWCNNATVYSDEDDDNVLTDFFDDDIAVLAKCQDITLSNCLICAQDLAKLVNLQRISLINCPGLTDNRIVHFSNCRKVRLIDCKGLTGACLKHLAKCQVVILDIDDISVEEIKHLSNCDTVGFHSECNLTDDHLEHLSKCRKVRLYGQKSIKGPGLKYLENSVTLDHCHVTNKHLEYLDCCEVNITNRYEDRRLITDGAYFLGGCDTVRLECCFITDFELANLGHCRVVELVTCPKITAKGLASLANCERVLVRDCGSATGEHIYDINLFLPLANCKQVISESTDITEEIRKLKESQKSA